jgi:hypothetical protein
MKPVHYKYLLLFIAFITVKTTTKAQALMTDSLAQGEPNLRLLAKNYGDSVVLIWTPALAHHWMQAKEKGYVLERLEMDANTNEVKTTLLTPTPQKPWTPETFKARLDKKDNYLLIAAQALYGKNMRASTAQDPSVSADSLGIFGNEEEEKNRLFFAAMSMAV